MWKKITTLILWMIPVFLVQLGASRITMGSVDTWYQVLQKPSWTPAPWVFAPIWTILYLGMGVAAWLVYETKPHTERHIRAYVLFIAQLLCNGFWSYLFFGHQQIGWALIDLTLLIVLVGWTSWVFFTIQWGAGLIFLVYLVWLLFAWSLNLGIWWLNL